MLSKNITHNECLRDFQYYYYIKKPQYFGACVIAIVTLNVIIGYELQVFIIFSQFSNPLAQSDMLITGS